MSAETPVNLALLAASSPKGRLMDRQALRLLVRQKLADGRLPHDSIPRLWGGPSQGEICHACEEVIAQPALVMEGIALGGKTPLQLHVQCFYVWDGERRGADGVVGG